MLVLQVSFNQPESLPLSPPHHLRLQMVPGSVCQCWRRSFICPQGLMHCAPKSSCAWRAVTEWVGRERTVQFCIPKWPRRETFSLSYLSTLTACNNHCRLVAAGFPFPSHLADNRCVHLAIGPRSYVHCDCKIIGGMALKHNGSGGVLNGSIHCGCEITAWTVAMGC